MSDSWRSMLRDPSPWSAPSPLPDPVTIDDIVIRPYRKGDGPLLFEAVSERRDKLLPWMSWVTTDHETVDDSIHYVERIRRASEKPDCLDFPLGIFEIGSGAMLGGTGFHRIRPEFREAEIGYWIRGARHGKGLCTRAIGALMSASFRPASEGGWGFRRLVIFTARDNTGSRRVCEKLGLRLESRVKKDRYQEPFGYVDTVGYGVLEDEWDFAQNRALPGIAWE